MSLPAGRRLGPYEILSSLGAGGMGEVLNLYVDRRYDDAMAAARAALAMQPNLAPAQCRREGRPGG